MFTWEYMLRSLGFFIPLVNYGRNDIQNRLARLGFVKFRLVIGVQSLLVMGSLYKLRTVTIGLTSHFDAENGHK